MEKYNNTCYVVKGFCSKNKEENVVVAYKKRANANKRFLHMVKSECYEKVTLSLQNAVYFAETELILQCWIAE